MKLGCAVLLAWIAARASFDPAMEPPRLITSPGPEYSDANRLFQGIPGIERAPNGRLWAVWYAGDTREGPGNYVVLATSGDGGKHWSGPRLVIDPPGLVRAFDACLWHDPQGRMWLFWAQAAGHWDGRGGVWASVTSDSGSERPAWSAPRRIADGVLMNKPIALRSGEWLLPIAIWTKPAILAFINERDGLNLSAEQVRSLSHDLGDARGADVFSSVDQGRSVTLKGQPRFPAADQPGEHMLIERKDGSIWMLARTRYGIGSSVSSDGGRTWSPPVHSEIAHPSTRFFIRRLSSGALLLVKHCPPNGKDRSHLTAFVSDDEGRTWTGGLLLDERLNVSYPDGVEAKDGRIYVIYDRDRFAMREILMAAFREKDVRARKIVSQDAMLAQVVNRAAPVGLEGPGWEPLLNERNLSGWHALGGKSHTWYRAASVRVEHGAKRDLLAGAGGPGPLLINGPDGRTENLITDKKFGDIELYLEFLIPAKSNSGIYLHGLYEVQILDSFGVARPGVHDCGAIYERWINGKGVGGTPPATNASRAPGEWQSFHIWFRAPRFDSSGRKVENARFLRVDHNGVTIHRDVAAPGPTRASLEISEAPENPLMIQGDHGPIALRNIFVRPLGK